MRDRIHVSYSIVRTSLAGHSPGGQKDSGTTQRLNAAAAAAAIRTRIRRWKHLRQRIEGEWRHTRGKWRMRRGSGQENKQSIVVQSYIYILHTYITLHIYYITHTDIYLYYIPNQLLYRVSHASWSISCETNIVKLVMFIFLF